MQAFNQPVLVYRASSISLNSASLFFVRSSSHRENIVTMKLLSTAHEKLSKKRMKKRKQGRMRMLHSCEEATDYGSKSDDFQLKFNNACNMLKIHL